MSPDAYVEMARAQQGHWWFTGRRAILREQIAQLRLPPGAEILEIGSGTGANLEMLAEFGYVTALEMNADAIALAQASREYRGRLVTMRQGRCPDDLEGLPPFDLICLFDVLEHIDDDTLSLASLGRLLKPGGRLLVTVPAYQWLWGPHDVHLHHVRRYDRHSLARVCGQAGLGITRVSHFNTLLFPLALANRAFEKLMGAKTSAAAIPSAPLNALLRRLFASERHLLRRMRLPFGLSLLLVAQRSPGA